MIEPQLTSQEKIKICNILWQLKDDKKRYSMLDLKQQAEIKKVTLSRYGWTVEDYEKFKSAPNLKEILVLCKIEQNIQSFKSDLANWSHRTPEQKLNAIQWYMTDARVSTKNIRGAKASDYITFIASKLRTDGIVLPPKDIKDMAEYYMTYGQSQPGGEV